MSFSQALEVVIGLVFIYYVLGSIVSLVTQWINEALETRGRSLEKHLKRIVGDKHVDDFVTLPQLRALRPIAIRIGSAFLHPPLSRRNLRRFPSARLWMLTLTLLA
jgi:hypothetical protein